MGFAISIYPQIFIDSPALLSNSCYLFLEPSKIHPETETWDKLTGGGFIRFAKIKFSGTFQYR